MLKTEQCVMTKCVWVETKAKKRGEKKFTGCQFFSYEHVLILNSTKFHGKLCKIKQCKIF